jgi:hypothetical protein
MVPPASDEALVDSALKPTVATDRLILNHLNALAARASEPKRENSCHSKMGGALSIMTLDQYRKRAPQ